MTTAGLPFCSGPCGSTSTRKTTNTACLFFLAVVFFVGGNDLFTLFVFGVCFLIVLFRCGNDLLIVVLFDVEETSSLDYISLQDLQHPL